MRMELAWGEDLLMKQPDMIKNPFMRLMKEEGLGFCVNSTINNHFDDQDDSKSNFYDYEGALFNSKESRELFFADWPADAARPDTFEGWFNVVQKEWPGVNDWKDFGMEGQCLSGGMMDMMPGMDMDMDMFKDFMEGIDVEMRDDGVSISMEDDSGSMSIEMTEGENGTGSMRIIMEGAEKLAVASAAAIATTALF